MVLSIMRLFFIICSLLLLVLLLVMLLLLPVLGSPYPWLLLPAQ
jgi:hypothetical protein